MTDDDRIRALLDEAVSDVEPRRSLEEIRSRTTTERARRPWVWGAGGAVLATAATIAAVAVLSNGTGTTAGRPDLAPATQPTGPATSATERPAGRPAASYYVGNTTHGARLYPEASGRTGADQLEQAVDRALSGASADPDYFSLWPKGTILRRAELSDAVLSVDLGGDVANRPAGMTAAQAELALQQLVRSAQSAAGSTLPVLFLLDGHPTPTLLGLPTDRPVPKSSDDLLAQVQIASPGEGSQVTSPFTVTGRAAAFEANVQWELLDGNTLVSKGFSTAEECCTLSPYSFEVSAPPGNYTLVVHDEDASGGEGLPPWRDTKQLTVR
jgi:hypothetical protein